MSLLELIPAFLAPQVLLFLLFGVGALAAALTMLLHPNPVRAALFLVLNLFCVAVLYLLLNAYFLAAVQVVVYAGAIMVLFLFVIMLLNLGTPDKTKDRLRAQQPLAVVGGLVLAGAVALTMATAPNLPQLDAEGNPPVVQREGSSRPISAKAGMGGANGPDASPKSRAASGASRPSSDTPDERTVVASEQGTVAGIGSYLYDSKKPYLFPFEVTSILLLVATIGSVVLTKRKMPGDEPLAGEDLA